MFVAAPSRILATLRTRRAAVAAGVVAVAAGLSVATLSRGDLASAVGTAASEGLSKTVAAMLADRSPGERPEGALASLKHKRQPALHERALPKVRVPPPVPPLASIIGPPPAPLEVIPASPVPLFAMVGGPPVLVPPIPAIGGGGGGGGTPGSPPGFSNIPPPGGGGGGVIVPPSIQETPTTPSTPIPAVPEPGTWSMMLVGFAMIGWAIRRNQRAKPGLVTE
ncbi:MAG: PEPxxWA-CTERM sorting domain-containing protein [Sphingomicrobium sp.]